MLSLFVIMLQFKKRCKAAFYPQIVNIRWDTHED